MDMSQVRSHTEQFRTLTKWLACNVADLDLIVDLLDSVKDDDRTLSRVSRDVFADAIKKRYSDFSVDGLKGEIVGRLEMTQQGIEALLSGLPLVRDAVARALDELRPKPEGSP